jgi:eukaryotic translation initiation factor 2C
VSYATPTYYADRLCERGRLYLRDFFVASADHTEALQNLKFNAEAVRRRQREQRYGGIRNQDGSLRQKTDSERQQIRTDQDAVENLIRQETLRRANNVLNVNRYSKQNWRSPWPKEFGKVMFWL